MTQDKIESIAVSGNELQEFGCPYCGYRSGSTPVSGGGGAIWQCGDNDCGRSCVVLAEGVSKSPIGLGSGKETIYPELQDHPRRGIPAHGKSDKKPENGGEFFRSRGVGLDNTPGCFICGGNRGLHNNIAAFVQCKEAGKRVVAMFDGKGACLDCREYEPDRVQVKVGACKMHTPNLERLSQLTAKEDTGVLTKEMIQEAVSM